MRRASILSDLLFGALAGVPIAIVWYFFLGDISLGAALAIGLVLAPSGAAAAIVPRLLLKVGPLTPSTRATVYFIGAAAAVAISYAVYAAMAASAVVSSDTVAAVDLMPAAITGIFAVHAALGWRRANAA